MSSNFHFRLFLCTLCISTAFSATCHGEEALDPSGKYCYILHNGAENFHEAEKTCYNYGGYRLASVPNMIDNNFLYKLLQKSDAFSNYFWLGLTDMTDSGEWQWIDGSDMSFMNWSPVSSSGNCGSMRTADGRWQAQDCSQSYPFFCYGPAPGAPTDPPTTPKTTVIPKKQQEVMIKFMADAESLGDPNTDQNALKFYNNEREFIRAVADQTFGNPTVENYVCTFYMQAAFYGWAQYEQQFDWSAAWRKEQFDYMLESNKWDDGTTTHSYNITDAITGSKHYRWTPQMEDIGYTVLVFMTARQDFTGIPSLFEPFPNFDELVVVTLNGSKMSVPSNVTSINVSNDFNDNDIKNVFNALKCH